MTRSFDEQAAAFDQRSGLPAGVSEAIARELVEIARLGPRDVALEVGAGTGQIGLALSQRPLHYIGFDASAAMLGDFKRQLFNRSRPVVLIEADGNIRWPVEDGSVKAVFSSRAVHLSRVAHVVQEVFRVASLAGATLLLGRVQRDTQNLRSRLRQEMRERLRQLGYASQEGRQKGREILDSCICRGAAPLEQRIAAAWPVQHSAAQVLALWREKSGLAGLEVPPDVKETVLAQLALWAKDAFGSLEALESAKEKYVMEGVRLPSKS